MSDFKWTPKREKAALLLAQGYPVREVAEECKVADRTIFRWKNDIEFSTEIDRLTHMVGVATRAERLRIAMQVVRSRTELTGWPKSNRDLLEWLKFIQSETDGAKLELTTLFEAAFEPLAEEGQDRIPAEVLGRNGRGDS